MRKRMNRWMRPSAVGAVACCGIALGCQWYSGAPARSEPDAAMAVESPHAAAPTALAAPTSAPASVVWNKADKGLQLKYPADWQTRKSADYELMLLPPKSDGDGRRITMDIPGLPPHLPFMIQMSRVESGYIDDLKKDHADLKMKDAADAKVPNAKARLVCCTWHKGNQQYEDVALLMIHDGDVFILDAQSDEDHLGPTRSVFDAIEASIQWTRK